MNKYLYPEWQLPGCIRAASTTRLHGAGVAPFDSFNLGMHVGDDAEVVQSNRDLLVHELELPDQPQWLNQVHGCDICYVTHASAAAPTADAAWTDQPGCVLAVMTADCLPLLLASRSGDCVAVIHGGWRSLLADVVQQTVAAMRVEPAELSAWLGPAIGPEAFEVGAEVKDAFTKKNQQFNHCFREGSHGKYTADIFSIGRQCLAVAGVTSATGGDHCTFQDQTHFFSHRRDAGKTGRMASLVWIEPT